MAQDDNFDWIFDFVMEVLKSPEWEVPVMSFIDTNSLSSTTSVSGEETYI